MKEPKMALLVGIIIPKVDMDTQIPSSINPYEAVTYIDSSLATCLRPRRYVGLFIITLFGAAVYYKIKIKSTVATGLIAA